MALTLLSSTRALALMGSSTAVVSSNNPSVFGQSVTFTATVTGLILTPTGTVTFKDGAATLGTRTLNGSGQATFTTSALAAGGHSITVVYGGDPVYDPSTSPVLTQNVNLASTATAVISSLNPSTFGQSVTFTATVTSAGGTPTGNVTFKDGAATIGTGTLNGSGQATFATSALATGAHSITAVYDGSSNFSTSISPVLTQNVNLASTATAVISSLNPSAFGQSVTFTATVTSAGGTPTGNVTFKDGAATLGSGTLNGSGQATFATSALAAGAHSITAVYDGDSNFSTSTSPVLTQNVNANASSTAVVSSNNPSTFGQSVTFTATVTGAGPTPAGNVTFRDGAAVLGTGTLNGSGQATFATGALGAGSHSITAAYGGDSNYGASTSPVLMQNVNQSTGNVVIGSSVNPSALGQSVTFTATVSGSGGTPTGIVTFKDGAATLGSGTLNGSGQATFATSALAAGSHSITAEYGGDSNFTAGTSPPLTQTVNMGSTATAVTSSANPSTFRQIVTFTAVVSGSAGTPTGSVTFKDGTAALGSVTLSGGQATFSTSALAVGSHSITAAYSGSSQYGPSTSAVLTQVVQVPADSVKLRAMQVAVTRIAAQNSGQALSGAVNNAISEGFAGGGPLIAPSATGLRLNFAEQTPNGPARNAFASFDRLRPAFDPLPSRVLVWAELRGTGWSIDRRKSDIKGQQVNALAGITYRITPDLLVGLLGGYEISNYTSDSLSGRLKGEGWTSGGYFGWRILPGLRFDAAIAHTSLENFGTAGTASAPFSASRWIGSSGLAGTHRTTLGIDVEPSVQLFAVAQKERAYTDSLGTFQTARSFSTGRASAGAKFAYPFSLSHAVVAAPYIGIYGDYYFTKDDAEAVPLVPGGYLDGWSARIVSGIALTAADGARITAGGELGGIGAGIGNVWSVRMRGSVPF